MSSASRVTWRERVLRGLPVSVRRRWLYARSQRDWLRLRRPRTFSEKVNWRIVYDRRPLLGGTCDKLAMKAYASSHHLALRVPATYWSGTDVGELAGVGLPPDWVLKPNHRYGLVELGSGQPDTAQLRERTRGWLDERNWSVLGEWAYQRARPCLLAEERIGDAAAVPNDYKVFVFDGVPRLIEVDYDRTACQTRRFYTPQWTPLPHTNRFPLAAAREQPPELAELLEIAARLGEPFDFMRVDLYLVDGEIWFGELTPYSGGGLRRFTPRDLDATLGAYWQLAGTAVLNEPKVRTDGVGAAGGAAAVRNALLRALPLRLRRRLWYWQAYRRRLRLRDPVTFSEKMNWRIVHDRRDLLAVTCDKLASKEFAREQCAGLPLRVPATYWSGTDVAELAGVALPQSWMLKPNHRSGLVIFGSGTPDPQLLGEQTAGWLDEWQWSMWGEWAYRFARPSLLVEERIGGDGRQPPDYKTYVFDGVPRFIQVIEGRLGTTTQRFYTPEWEALPYESNSRLGPVRPRPAELALLLEIAGRIGAPFEFMRVDLYAAAGEVWFGELTPYSHGGYRVSPTPGVEEELGALWQLPGLPRP